MRFISALLFLLAFTRVAAGQDSSSLRQRYGQPDVERFEIHSDMNVTVVYGANGHSQSLIIEPRQAFIHAAFSGGRTMTLETALEIVRELIPETRGKPLSDLGEFQASCGVGAFGALGDVRVSYSFSACSVPIAAQAVSASVPNASSGPRSPSDFRARYGEPDAERFVIKRNPIDQIGKKDLTLMVEYGADREACRVRVEPRHEFEKSFPVDKSVPAEEFASALEEVVPLWIRGAQLGERKPIGALCYQAPLPTEYENVIINPYFSCDRPAAIIGMEIYFKRPVCEDLPAYMAPIK